MVEKEFHANNAIFHDFFKAKPLHERLNDQITLVKQERYYRGSAVSSQHKSVDDLFG